MALNKIINWLLKPLLARIAALEAKLSEIEAEWPTIKGNDNGTD